MRVIQFLEPVDDDFIGPFDSEMEALVWLRENERTERHVIHHMVSPVACMFRAVMCWNDDDATRFGELR